MFTCIRSLRLKASLLSPFAVPLLYVIQRALSVAFSLSVCPYCFLMSFVLACQFPTCPSSQTLYLYISPSRCISYIVEHACVIVSAVWYMCTIGRSSLESLQHHVAFASVVLCNRQCFVCYCLHRLVKPSWFSWTLEESQSVDHLVYQG